MSIPLYPAYEIKKEIQKPVTHTLGGGPHYSNCPGASHCIGTDGESQTFLEQALFVPSSPVPAQTVELIMQNLTAFTCAKTRTLRTIQKLFIKAAVEKGVQLEPPIGCAYGRNRELLWQYLGWANYKHNDLLSEAIERYSKQKTRSHRVANLHHGHRVSAKSIGKNNENRLLTILHIFGITTPLLLEQFFSRHRSTIINLLNRLGRTGNKRKEPSKKRYIENYEKHFITLSEDGIAAASDLLGRKPAPLPQQIEHIIGIQETLLNLMRKLGIKTLWDTPVQFCRPGFRKANGLYPDFLLKFYGTSYFLEFDRTHKAWPRLDRVIQMYVELLEIDPNSELHWYANPKTFRYLRKRLSDPDGIFLVTEPETLNIWIPTPEECERRILPESTRDRIHLTMWEK